MLNQKLVKIIISISFTLLFQNNGIAQQQNSNFNWTHTARLVGWNTYYDATTEEIHQQIDKHSAEGVSVMLIWTWISGETIKWSNNDKNFLNDVATYTHTNYPEMKVIVYVAPLEKQTTDVDINQDGIIDAGKKSIYSEHPEWLQIGIDGSPAVFYGSIAFWLDPTSEDVWLCPNDPEYRQIWIDNFSQLAQTGIDGVWWDVPFFIHYFGDDWDEQWSCHCSDCETKFSNDTGNSIPKAEDWNNQNWRKFIDWRYQSMGNFISDCKDAAIAINPNFKLINEAWNSINQFEPQVGFEPSLTRISNYNDGVAHEFHPIEPKEYHYYTWLLDAVMGITFRGIDQYRASWILSYSDEIEHAKTRCANVLFTGCNFYEVNYPMMSSTVDLNLRTELFNWIKVNEKFYYGKNITPFVKVALLYSSPSINYYGTFPEVFAEEFKGIGMMLLESHIPFEVLPNDLLDSLGNYEVLILPNVSALSDDEIFKIKSFVQNGGKLISTGWTSYFNFDGSSRNGFGLLDVFGNEPQESTYKIHQYGDGTSISTRSILGIDYFYAANPNEIETKSNHTNAENIRNKFLTNLWQPINSTPNIITTASREIIFNTFIKNDTLIVRANNLSQLKWNKDYPNSVSDINIKIKIPTEWKIKSAFQVELLGQTSKLSFETLDDNYLSCTFDLDRHSILYFINSNITSVENSENAKVKFSIGPNPASNLLQVNLQSSAICSYKIYNSIGQLVMSNKFTTNKISLSNLVNGIYFIQVETIAKTYIRKFAIIK